MARLSKRERQGSFDNIVSDFAGIVTGGSLSRPHENELRGGSYYRSATRDRGYSHRRGSSLNRHRHSNSDHSPSGGTDAYNTYQNEKGDDGMGFVTSPWEGISRSMSRARWTNEANPSQMNITGKSISSNSANTKLMRHQKEKRAKSLSRATDARRHGEMEHTPPLLGLQLSRAGVVDTIDTFFGQNNKQVTKAPRPARAEPKKSSKDNDGRGLSVKRVPRASAKEEARGASVRGSSIRASQSMARRAERIRNNIKAQRKDDNSNRRVKDESTKMDVNEVGTEDTADDSEETYFGLPIGTFSLGTAL